MKMLQKIPRIILKVNRCFKLSARTSALFINGPKATDTFAYLTPHIDFPEQLQHKTLIEQQLKRRKCEINLDKVVKLWSIYEELNKRKCELSTKKDEISRELTKLIKSDPECDEVKKYKIQVNLLKENIKKLKPPLWSAEEAAFTEVLKLPNSLHLLTQDENKILFTHLSSPTFKKDHLQIAKDLGLIYFKKNENYYLKGDAALFELGAKFYFSDLLKKNKFVQFSNPDFVKSVIVEGCGKDHTHPDTTFILHHNEDTKISVDNRLHLTGGASLQSYFAYLSKNVLYPKVFPLQYFTMGRQYIPSPSDEDSLFHVSQSSVIELFGAVKNSQEADDMFHKWIEIVKAVYIDLGMHFRLSLVSADKLLMHESLKATVEMFSSSLNSYIEVANISLSNDFICKRLLLTYVENKETKFPHVISGTVLNVPKLLGCILEQDSNFVVPKQFKVENWTL